MLEGLLDDLLADSPPKKGEIRPFRPSFRPDEIQQPRGFSPNSPLSPLECVIPDSPMPASDPPPDFWNRVQAIAEELDNVEVDVRADEAPEPVHLREYLRRAVDTVERLYAETDIDAVAAAIASEFHATTAECLALLDDDDKRAIETGDKAMIEAWRTAVRLRHLVRYRLTGSDGTPMATQSSVMPRPGQTKGELIERLKREFGARLILCDHYEI